MLKKLNFACLFEGRNRGSRKANRGRGPEREGDTRVGFKDVPGMDKWVGFSIKVGPGKVFQLRGQTV